ncbi:MAG: isopentenyl phosphate kinase family protein [Hadesarchaea archaeon]|nr:isopentenyl phosphate kinase family protein [Hadesarchaea archaeon]
MKLGGSVITDKSEELSLNRDALNRLAKELKSVESPLIVIHGGGSFGHPLASRYGINSGFENKSQLSGFALTHWAMEALNFEVTSALRNVGLPAVSIQTSACTITKNGRIESMEIKPIKKMLEIGLIPVLYGDSVMDSVDGMKILSGDQLAVFLAEKLGVDRVILGVDTDGVYKGDPKQDDEAELIPEITMKNWPKISESIESASGVDVTGGMKRKIEELMELPKIGIEAQIINASKPEVLEKAIKGDKSLGTRILKGE